VASAWFADKGFAVSARYPYILADREEWSQNIILPEVAQYIREEHARREALRQGFPLHKYIHHGLSSQAMLFNLVGPLIVAKDLDPLRQAFTRQGIAWPEGEVSQLHATSRSTVSSISHRRVQMSQTILPHQQRFAHPAGQVG